MISFVASGHVLFLDTASRAPVDCLRTSIGSTGFRQVHFALPAPNDRYIGVANQNGKMYERIDTDYATHTFVLNPANSIDLATCTTPNGSHIFASLRGLNQLTADPHVSTGSTPGVAVLKVIAGGRDGHFEAVARVSNVDADGVDRADVHALTIRRKWRPPARPRPTSVTVEPAAPP